MTVSVIIPCYKDAAKLGRALDSVSAQTYPVEEVIVVNDASPETREIEAVLVSYPQVAYVVNKQNLGLAATRNVGVNAASGSVICFLDADDELHPQKIETQLTLYHPKRAISCNVKRIGDERGIDGAVYHHGIVKYRVHYSSARLIRRNVLTGASLMISRKLFLAHGGYDETLRACEDFDLWLRLMDAGVPIFNIESPLYFYRVNEHGLSSNLLSVSRWELEVVKKYYRRRHFQGARPADEGNTLALWLFRHFIRYAQCQDPQLFQATHANLALLNPWPQARMALLFLQKVGILRLVAYIVHRRKH